MPTALPGIAPSLRKLVLVACIATATAPLIHAQDASTPAVSWSANTSVWSRYVWRGVRFSNDAVWQSTVTAAMGGLSVSAWSNYDFDTSRLNEVDGTIDWAFTAKSFSFNLGWTHFGCIDAADSDEIYLLGSAPVGDWTVSLGLYADVNYGRGAYVQAGLARSFALSEAVSLDLGATAGVVFNNSWMGVNSEGDEFVGPFAGEVSAALTWQISEKMSLAPKVAYAFPLSSDAREAISTYGYGTASTTLYGGVQLNLTF